MPFYLSIKRHILRRTSSGFVVRPCAAIFLCSDWSQTVTTVKIESNPSLPSTRLNFISFSLGPNPSETWSPGRTSPQGGQKYCGSSCSSGSCNCATLLFQVIFGLGFTPIISSQSCEQFWTKTEWKDTLSSEGHFKLFCCSHTWVCFFVLFVCFFCKQDDLTWCKSGFCTQSSFGDCPGWGLLAVVKTGRYKGPKSCVKLWAD